MKKINLSIVLAISLLSVNTNAGVWDTTKEYTNKAMFWKNKHLEDIDFKHIYPKAFYKKSYFGFAITGAVVVGAGAFTYFTAGAGAPAAATGVTTVTTFVSGGGAGSYMAGLSTVGGWFGGNAVLGASILNGISIGVGGGAVGVTAGKATFATMGILAKVGVMASITAAGLDGVFYFSNPDTKKLEYRVRVSIPKNLGGKDTRNIVNKIYEIDEEIQDAIEENDKVKHKELLSLKKEYNEKAIKLLEIQLYKSDNQEDLLILGIIAWNNNKIDLFNNAISKIDTSKLEDMGFLNYLYSLQNLSKGNENKALINLQNSIDENDYAVEPYILSISILGNTNFIKNETKIVKLIEEADDNFDSDKYESKFGLVPLYYRLATFYFTNKRYIESEKYYEKAYDELGIFQKHFFGQQLVNIINLGKANSLYQQGKINKADEIFIEIIKDCETEEEKQRIKNQFMGNK